MPRCVRVLAAPMAAIARRCPGPRSSDWTRRAAASRSEKLWCCCSDSPLSLKILSAWISANSSAPKASLIFYPDGTFVPPARQPLGAGDGSPPTVAGPPIFSYPARAAECGSPPTTKPLPRLSCRPTWNHLSRLCSFYPSIPSPPVTPPPFSQSSSLLGRFSASTTAVPPHVGRGTWATPIRRCPREGSRRPRISSGPW